MTNRAEIVITALDKASAVINRISDRMEALSKKSNLGQAFDRLGNTAGLERVNSALGKIGGNMKTVAMYGGLAAGAVGLAFSKSVGSVDDFADSMANAGIAGKDLVEISALRDYMGQFGVSSEDASAAMIKLTGNMSAARAGSEAQAAAFKAAGISMEDLKTKSPVEIMKKMMDVFSQSDRAGAKIKVMQALAGKGSVKMVDALSQGAAGLEEYKKKFAAALLTDKDFKNSGPAADALTRISGLVKRAMEKMAATAAPKIQAFLGRREAGLLELIPKLVAWMDRFMDSIDEKKVMQFFSDVGGVMSALGKVFRWLNDNTSAATKVILLLGLAFAPAIAALVSIGTVAIPLVMSAFSALTALMMANPIIAIIAVIAAAAFLIYKNWDSIVGYFVKVFARIKGVFDVGFFDGMFQVWLEGWQLMGNGIIAILKSIPLIGDLDIIKNIDKLDFASKRAQSLTNKIPQSATGSTPESFPGGKSAAQVISGGAGQKVDFAGRLKIEVDDKRVKVTDLFSSNKALPMSVGMGAGFYGMGT